MPTITSKGQITVPKQVRAALGLSAGSQVEFEVTGGVAVMRKRLSPAALQRWRGYLRRQGVRKPTDDLVSELRDP